MQTLQHPERDAAESGVLPTIIQGGMGIAVSDWRLARAVSRCGELGVVSGTALDAVLARRLQLGDPKGDLRRALDAFPDPDMAQRVWDRYYRPEGRVGRGFKSRPLPGVRPSPALQELTVVANFVEVFLAKEGHAGIVGLNLLEKVRLPTLPSLFGAMLAGVDYVLMGAGIPRAIPAMLDGLAAWRPTEHPIEVKGDGDAVVRLDPAAFLPHGPGGLKRPRFLPIVSSAVLATTLVRKGTGRVDGFVIEGRSAGGHNAPPRGAQRLDERGEPIYGPRDEADLAAFRELGLPFWLAGSYATPERLREARAAGAAGVQAGTVFAFCEESGIRPDLKRRVLERCRAGDLDVRTDPLASPTGFPFKVAQLEGTLADEATFEARPRVCDLGYLRQTYAKPDGSVGFRCSAEPEAAYVQKGGALEETAGRKCVCNGLMATVGLGQVRKGGVEEPPLVTAGNDFGLLKRLLKPDGSGYAASEVVDLLRSGLDDAS